jgi:hypothetical protein
MWHANVMSGVRLSRRCFPQMLQRRYGRIVFISSESALQVPADVIHCGVSKTAQLALACGLAELAVGVDVTVNSVLVGPTRSEGMGAILKGMARARQTSEAEAETWVFQKVRPSSLLKRFLRPQEIGAFGAFLASDEASRDSGRCAARRRGRSPIGGLGAGKTPCGGQRRCERAQGARRLAGEPAGDRPRLVAGPKIRHWRGLERETANPPALRRCLLRGDVSQDQISQDP